MSMQKKKMPRDANSLAAQIVAMSTGQPLPKLTESAALVSIPVEPEKEKNHAAVSLGRLGGLKGGKARAESLSKKKRVEIARLAASARWRKSGN